MTRSQRLSPLLGVANQRQDDAAQDYAQAVKSHSDQEARLEALVAYRDGYVAQLSQPGGATSAARLSDYAQFIAKLDGAINEQRQQLSRSAAQSESQRAQWLETRRESHAYEELIKGYQSAEARARVLREEREAQEAHSALNHGGRND